MAVVLACGLMPTPARAATLGDRFEAANAHYFNEDYGKAKRAYLKLIKQFQLTDPALYFNLGNAHFQLGELGWATLSYKRALDAEPNEALEGKIRANLSRTRGAIMERYRKDGSAPVAVLDETHGVLYGFFHLLNSAQAALLFAAFWVAFFAALVLRRRYAPGREGRARLRMAAIVLAVPTFMAATLLIGNIVTTKRVVRGIIVAGNVQIQDGKHPDAPHAPVPEGLEVRILDDSDPVKTRIQLSNGKEGWVAAEAVEAINRPPWVADNRR